MGVGVPLSLPDGEGEGEPLGQLGDGAGDSLLPGPGRVGVGTGRTVPDAEAVGLGPPVEPLPGLPGLLPDGLGEADGVPLADPPGPGAGAPPVPAPGRPDPPESRGLSGTVRWPVLKYSNHDLTVRRYSCEWL